MSVVASITTSVDGYVAGPCSKASKTDVELDVQRVYNSPCATHVRYAVKRMTHPGQSAAVASSSTRSCGLRAA